MKILAFVKQLTHKCGYATDISGWTPREPTEPQNQGHAKYVSVSIY